MGAQNTILRSPTWMALINVHRDAFRVNLFLVPIKWNPAAGPILGA